MITDEQLKPGRELDAIIAEQIMGGTRDIYKRPYAVRGRLHPDFADEVCLRMPDGDLFFFDSKLGSKEIPAYSTDMYAAWRVVEKITDIKTKWGSGFTIRHEQHCWRAGWIQNYETGREWEISAEAHTAPFAICLVALRMKANE